MTTNNRQIGSNVPQMTVLRARREQEYDCDIDTGSLVVSHFERDDEDKVTVYLEELPSGELYYLTLNQELINRLKTI